MSQYVVVENAQITERYDAVPENWRNISNFILMTDSERAAYGFLQVKQSDVTYDPIRSVLISNDIKLDANLQPYIDLVIEPTMTDQQYQEYLFNESLSILRNRRDSLLCACDWTMTQDMIELKGQDWKTDWSTYRQQLRDFTNPYKTNQNPFDPNSVNFPNIPQL